MVKKLKILFIPADSIDLHVSRSFFIAQALSENNIVYYVKWNDYRNHYWKNKKLNHFKRIYIFFSNIFSGTAISTTNSPNFYEVNCSLFMDAFINKIIGKSIAKRIMYSYNKKSLAKVSEKLEPDLIFYADGFYFSSIVYEKSIHIVDFQDDFSKDIISINMTHLEENIKKSSIICLLSKAHEESLKKKLTALQGKKIHYLPNGVSEKDFKLLENKKNNTLKSCFGNGKTIISYIGAAYWIDTNFAKEVVSELMRIHTDIVFVFVGNIKPFIHHPNVIFTGSVSYAEANKYFFASDIGVLLKAANDDFAYNSIPLKILQYGICGKPVIIPCIRWFEILDAPNVHIVKDFNPINFIQTFKYILEHLDEKNEETKQFWHNFTWFELVKNLNEELQNEYNNKTKF